jgi:hypothetical protein
MRVLSEVVIRDGIERAGFIAKQAQRAAEDARDRLAFIKAKAADASAKAKKLRSSKALVNVSSFTPGEKMSEGSRL